MLNPLVLGPAILALNTTAYTAEIFYGALQTVPRGEIEAARAYGMSWGQRFRRIAWPHLIRIAWPAYTNEVVFLFHATALVYFTLPVIGDQKDLMNKAGELLRAGLQRLPALFGGRALFPRHFACDFLRLRPDLQALDATSATAGADEIPPHAVDALTIACTVNG